MVSDVTVSNVTFCSSKEDTIAAWKIVLKFHMLLLYIYHQKVSKQCFLVGEIRYQSCVCCQALKGHFLAKIMFFKENFIVNTF